MDGQVKEARGQQLQALDLHPVDEDVGPRILDEFDKSLDDSAVAWMKQSIALKYKGTPGHYRLVGYHEGQKRHKWVDEVDTFSAVLLPFQCDFEVLMSY